VEPTRYTDNRTGASSGANRTKENVAALRRHGGILLTADGPAVLVLSLESIKARLYQSACPIAGAYRYHGEYVSCVAAEAEAQVNEGLIEATDKDIAISTAAQSDVGKTK
jgi:hypothetical protein